MLAPLLLAGCVTVIVPTATPEPTEQPSPSPRATPVLFTGFGGVGKSVSESHDMAGGQYAASWQTIGGYCRIGLDLVTMPDEQPVYALVIQQTTNGAMATPAAITNVLTLSPGAFAVLARSATCPWAVAMTRVR